MDAKAAVSKVQFINLHQELIDGCRRGDQKAQFQIYKLYYKAMYNTSLRIVKSTMEAEDIMQEAFLTAFENIASYSGTVSFGAWLKKIVQNKSFDYLRRNKIIIYKDLQSFREMEDTWNDDEGKNEESATRLHQVIEKIKLLPEKYRNILSLYLFEGYDHEEISQILSIPGNTSRSNFSRARKKLVSSFQVV